MSEQVSKQKTDTSGRLAVVGDRELVIGYRLIGIDDTFIVTDEEDASKKIQELYSSGEFGLIIASNSMRDKLSSKFIAEIEESIEPLVLFIYTKHTIKSCSSHSSSSREMKAQSEN